MDTIRHWAGEAQAWLDARGKGAWIAALVIALILFWPVGLALLLYMIWSNRMSCSARHWSPTGTRFRPSGNSAFDAYRDATLKRLEDEQSAFQESLERLRKVKDQSEFDRFMDDRAKRPPTRDSGNDEPWPEDGSPAPA